MRTFSINTLGCKVNQYESQQIRRFLEQIGLRQVPTTQEPDFVVVNTCCVTHTASARSRQCIGKAQRLNPDTAVVICGCLPKLKTDELKISTKNTYVVGKKGDITATLSRLITRSSGSKVAQDKHTSIKAQNHHKIKDKSNLSGHILPSLKTFKGHTRAFLKVQDGCDGFCSYCIIPQTRPVVQSRDAEKIIAEAQQLVKSGHREIVVTGIFLGAFGQNTVRRQKWPNGQNEKLPELLERLARVPNLPRIRLSSLEPADVTERLLNTFCNFPNIMPHLHLSVQSGSDSILKKMARQYRVNEFIDKVEMVKDRLDTPAITTDIIVGFPGETDEDFQKTIDLTRQVGFAKMHIFTFSPRKGTVAASMQDIVPGKIIKRRSQILRDLDKKLGYQFRQQFTGRTANVLIEQCSAGTATGRSERYFRVHIEDSKGKFRNNDIVQAELIENTSDAAIARSITG